MTGVTDISQPCTQHAQSSTTRSRRATASRQSGTRQGTRNVDDAGHCCGRPRKGWRACQARAHRPAARRPMPRPYRRAGKAFHRAGVGRNQRAQSSAARERTTAGEPARVPPEGRDPKVGGDPPSHAPSAAAGSGAVTPGIGGRGSPRGTPSARGRQELPAGDCIPPGPEPSLSRYGLLSVNGRVGVGLYAAVAAAAAAAAAAWVSGARSAGAAGGVDGGGGGGGGGAGGAYAAGRRSPEPRSAGLLRLPVTIRAAAGDCLSADVPLPGSGPWPAPAFPAHMAPPTRPGRCTEGVASRLPCRLVCRLPCRLVVYGVGAASRHPCGPHASRETAGCAARPPMPRQGSKKPEGRCAAVAPPASALGEPDDGSGPPSPDTAMRPRSFRRDTALIEGQAISASLSMARARSATASARSEAIISRRWVTSLSRVLSGSLSDAATAASPSRSWADRKALHSPSISR